MWCQKAGGGSEGAVRGGGSLGSLGSKAEFLGSSSEFKVHSVHLVWKQSSVLLGIFFSKLPGRQILACTGRAGGNNYYAY